MKRISLVSLSLLAGGLLYSTSASAASCVNKFVVRSEAPRQVVTLLTGKLNYQEAQALVSAGRPVEWMGDNGKLVAKATDLKVVRPMPVACDGKSSGVVMVGTFLTFQKPAATMNLKLDGNAVTFTEQKD